MNPNIECAIDGTDVAWAMAEVVSLSDPIKRQGTKSRNIRGVFRSLSTGKVWEIETDSCFFQTRIGTREWRRFRVGEHVAIIFRPSYFVSDESYVDPELINPEQENAE